MKPIFALVLTAALFFACEPVTNPTPPPPPPPVPVLNVNIAHDGGSYVTYHGDYTFSYDPLVDIGIVFLTFTNNSNDTLVLSGNSGIEILAKGEVSKNIYRLYHVSNGLVKVTPRNAYGDGTTVTLSIKP